MIRPITFTDAPPTPLRGMRVFTLERSLCGPDAHPLSKWSLGRTCRVDYVNGRSFYVRDPFRTKRERKLRVEWLSWLCHLQTAHQVWLLRSEDDPAGWLLLRPLQVVLTDVNAVREAWVGGPDPFELRQRLQRARFEVIPRYGLIRADGPDGVATVAVQNSVAVYQVVVHPDGAGPPRCSCPDAEHRTELHGGFCKHVLAVLLSYPDLRAQALPAIL
jgi:hypothetical protein